MEIGSFLELDLRDTGEYYQGNSYIARLNTGRCSIFHALNILDISTIQLPYYLCPTVKNFLTKKGIKVIPYYISEDFEPILSFNEETSSVLIVNYFGILSNKIISELKERFQNVIIDNSPAFFSAPVKDCYNIYSARKFFGVPDGSYVIGPTASKGVSKYDQDSSSDTSAFLLKRIEKGCSAVYAERMENENRLDKADIMRMSDLTRKILQSIDYEQIKIKRLENFNFAHSLFRPYNLLDLEKFMDQNCIPMVYPLVVEDKDLVDKLNNQKIYTGRWWKSVLNDVPANCFEAHLSRFMVPIPIDQRYGREAIDFIFKTFKKVCH